MLLGIVDGGPTRMGTTISKGPKQRTSPISSRWHQSQMVASIIGPLLRMTLRGRYTSCCDVRFTSQCTNDFAFCFEREEGPAF